MIELRHAGQVAAACGGDDLPVWTAQRLPAGGARAWAHGDAVAVACPAVSKHDRLAVFGAAGDPALPALVRQVWREMGTGYRPFGDRETIHRLAEAMPAELGPAGNFTWMTVDPGTVRLDALRPDTSRPDTGRLERGPASASTPEAGHPAGEKPAGGRAAPALLVKPDVAWLDPGAEAEVAAVLAVANPDAYARPGMPGVTRWAGIRDDAGRLIAVGADAWSAPSVGFVGGVATLPEARGSGLAGAICRFLTAALLHRHGRVSLMADDVNTAALAVYRRLGYTRRPVAATRAVPEA
ncbi:GNAT family N-acetyltransferase [Herbidospora yilanensis]|uniref:GNAT family N-acetyltransferase n=1 Tax=Herbidospora yilanensis TaxID=354426 RepID=UPI000783DB7D|nr:GNAT family N-acetyltransferase [Herbidospora yilanensis]